MQYLTMAQAREWAVHRGYAINESFGHPVASELSPASRFVIPEDAGMRVTLARTLWESAGQGEPEVLLWVTDRGVWPSGEHMPLAEAARRGFGAERSLDETPGHLARLGEDDAALSILSLAVLFLWDCWVLPAGRGLPVFVSHDEYGVIGIRGEDRGLVGRLAALGVATAT